MKAAADAQEVGEVELLFSFLHGWDRAHGGPRAGEAVRVLGFEREHRFEIAYMVSYQHGAGHAAMALRRLKAFYCTQAVLGSMRAHKDGVVINISSWAGKYTSAMVGAAYNGSKHAVVSLTETINMEECVNGIRACAICPAEVATPILDRRPVPPSPEERAKMLQPADLGETILWVAQQPAHVCVNEITISPTWNRIYVGGADMIRR